MVYILNAKAISTEQLPDTGKYLTRFSCEAGPLAKIQSSIAITHSKTNVSYFEDMRKVSAGPKIDVGTSSKLSKGISLAIPHVASLSLGSYERLSIGLRIGGSLFSDSTEDQGLSVDKNYLGGNTNDELLKSLVRLSEKADIEKIEVDVPADFAKKRVAVSAGVSFSSSRGSSSAQSFNILSSSEDDNKSMKSEKSNLSEWSSVTTLNPNLKLSTMTIQNGSWSINSQDKKDAI
jgi:hypothetical protein|tara:strand:- start:494 stop:1195 length:702 start_codon:yes stop_codon:yes gene_type:complete